MTHAAEKDTVESLIRWVETGAPQVRNAEGAVEAYVIPVEDWRQMRSAIRRVFPPTEG